MRSLRLHETIRRSVGEGERVLKGVGRGKVSDAVSPGVARSQILELAGVAACGQGCQVDGSVPSTPRAETG